MKFLALIGTAVAVAIQHPHEHEYLHFVNEDDE